ncbi:hypothetical protein QNH26_01840 [Peribacillus frigoritolerans]|nr:hypothetical protein [Peribacillus frigoritolerans]WHX67417.1 hypothetical protein QNH26_01840 [Peribacillus frigoritolerans]
MAKSANISANASVHQPIRESHGKLAHTIREGRQTLDTLKLIKIFYKN